MQAVAGSSQPFHHHPCSACLHTKNPTKRRLTWLCWTLQGSVKLGNSLQVTGQRQPLSGLCVLVCLLLESLEGRLCSLPAGKWALLLAAVAWWWCCCVSIHPQHVTLLCHTPATALLLTVSLRRTCTVQVPMMWTCCGTLGKGGISMYGCKAQTSRLQGAAAVLTRNRACYTWQATGLRFHLPVHGACEFCQLKYDSVTSVTLPHDVWFSLVNLQSTKCRATSCQYHRVGNYLLGSVVRATRVLTASKGGMMPPLSTHFTTSRAFMRTCKQQDMLCRRI